jgi:hypothetical protein
MVFTATQITEIESANRAKARSIRNQNEALAVKLAADDLVAALDRSGGIYSTAAMYRLLDLCNAALCIADDDVLAQRDSLMDELGCDEYGNPVPSEGETDRFWRDSSYAINAGMGE